jgi:hypothetical protein
MAGPETVVLMEVKRLFSACELPSHALYTTSPARSAAIASAS